MASFTMYADTSGMESSRALEASMHRLEGSMHTWCGEGWQANAPVNRLGISRDQAELRWRNKLQHATEVNSQLVWWAIPFHTPGNPCLFIWFFFHMQAKCETGALGGGKGVWCHCWYCGDASGAKAACCNCTVGPVMTGSDIDRLRPAGTDSQRVCVRRGSVSAVMPRHSGRLCTLDGGHQFRVGP